MMEVESIDRERDVFASNCYLPHPVGVCPSGDYFDTWPEPPQVLQVDDVMPLSMPVMPWVPEPWQDGQGFQLEEPIITTSFAVVPMSALLIE